MSKCSKFLELLSAYADCEVTDAEKELIENHIKDCSLCKGKLDFILKTKQALKDSPEIPVPETLLKDFEACKEKQSSERKKVVPFYKNYRIYASIAAIILFAVVLKTGLWQDDTYINEESAPAPQTFISPSPKTADEDVSMGNVVAEPEKNENTQIQRQYQPEQKQLNTKTMPEESVPETAKIVPKENVPEVSNVALDSVNAPETEPEASGGGSNAPTEEPSDDFVEKIINHAIVYVSPEDLDKAAKLLSGGPYFYHQVEQKLNDNRIEFETNFLTLDESQPHTVVVMSKND